MQNRKLAGKIDVYQVVLILAAAMSLALSLPATVDAQDKGEQKKSVLDDLTSADREPRERAVDSLLAERKQTVERLIAIFDRRNRDRYDPEARGAAAYLLGELRAEEAASVLAEALAEQPCEMNPTDLGRYDFCVSRALAKIGPPAVPALIKNLEASDDEALGNMTLTTLRGILGWRSTMELLSKLHARALAQDPPNNAVVRRLRERQATFESRYSEWLERKEEEPLF